MQNALSTRKREKTTNPREHWLEYAENTYGKKLVMETKILLNVLVLYLPLPVFWALFDQQGSRWTLQATRMDGDLGFATIKPDQMQVINPLLILVFIPLYEVLFYPLLNLIGVRRPLQKIVLGGILAGVSFVSSMTVEIFLEKTYAVLPKPDEAQLRIFNSFNCEFIVDTNLPTSVRDIRVPPNLAFIDLNIPLKQQQGSWDYILRSTTPNCGNGQGQFILNQKTATSYFLTGSNEKPGMEPYEDHIQKSSQGFPSVRVLANLMTNSNIVLRDKDGDEHYEGMNNQSLVDVPGSTYEIVINGNTIKRDVLLKLGGVYTIIVQERSAGNFVRIFFCCYK